MSLTRKLISYLWPVPPATISDESKAALAADLKSTGSFSVPDDANRQRVDVWTRHRDNLARAENRAYLRIHAKQFASRWACLGLGARALAWLSEGWLWIEAPMTLAGAAALLVAAAFWYAYRGLNRIEN